MSALLQYYPKKEASSTEPEHPRREKKGNEKFISVGRKGWSTEPEAPFWLRASHHTLDGETPYQFMAFWG